MGVPVGRDRSAILRPAAPSIDAKHQPEAAASASSNFADKDGNNKSPAAAITNQHRMTLEEACLILNVKKDEPLDVIEKVR